MNCQRKHDFFSLDAKIYSREIENKRCEIGDFAFFSIKVLLFGK